MALVLFLILGAYYVLKTARQAFILTSSRSPAESLGDHPFVLARRNAELLAGLFGKAKLPTPDEPVRQDFPIGARVGGHEFLACMKGNITCQHDSKQWNPNLYALNVILHVYFEPSRYRQERRPAPNLPSR